jgi:hypothetical protein
MTRETRQNQQEYKPEAFQKVALKVGFRERRRVTLKNKKQP